LGDGSARPEKRRGKQRQVYGAEQLAEHCGARAANRGSGKRANRNGPRQQPS